MNCPECSPSRLKGFARKLRQTANLMVGQPDYDTYLAHARTAPRADADDADGVLPQPRGPAFWRWATTADSGAAEGAVL